MKPKTALPARAAASWEGFRYSKALKLHSDADLHYLSVYLAELEADLNMAPVAQDHKPQNGFDVPHKKTEDRHKERSSRRKFRSNDYMIFSADAMQHISKTAERTTEKYTWLGESLRMSFKMLRSDTRLVRTMLHSHGFMQCSNKNPLVNVVWAGASMKAAKMRDLQPWQRLNQFPRSKQLTRKDFLYENIERSKSIFGNAFDFIPEFYVVPREHARFAKALLNLEAQIERNEAVASFPGEFIVKPVDSCQGKGIFFVSSTDEIPLEGPLLASRYLAKPYLVNGHKFDLRIYVAVTSFYPLVAYVYSEGLTRLASMPYDASSCSSSRDYIHLTNYSINKNSTSFVRNESMSAEDLGHKWTLGALLRYMEKEGIDAKLLMLRIEDLVVKSLLSIQCAVASISKTHLRFVGTNFELFGFDVLIDEALKPWLLEVNLSPSLACDAPLDSLIKTRLMTDLLNLACIPLIDRKTVDSFAQLRPFIHTPESHESSDLDEELRSAENLVNVKTLKKRPVGIKRSVLNRRLANGVVSQNEQRLQSIVRRVKLEEDRRGDFIRVFPRKETWNLYSGLMEDLGSEDYDQKLYEEIIMSQTASREGSVEKKLKREDEEEDGAEELEEIADVFHAVMINPQEYPTLELVPRKVREIIGSWYNEAKEYTKKITQEGEIYAQKLPAMRPSARVRTKSCTEFYEVRKEKLKGKKLAAAAAASQKQATSSDKENSQPDGVPAI
ncbi:unnamed protein product [Caenorhabditis auriculariae]|uniref:Tubulin--tyrosine ligase-like protein 5 n=1 Tax=Caenorhabditis auriculariae TaxID=2777116 RepID=A0A8S1GSP4_9PELO|nr:unnamed protein product [Caenorhabditis auriculariae]